VGRKEGSREQGLVLYGLKRAWTRVGPACDDRHVEGSQATYRCSASRTRRRPATWVEHGGLRGSATRWKGTVDNGRSRPRTMIRAAATRRLLCSGFHSSTRKMIQKAAEAAVTAMACRVCTGTEGHNGHQCMCVVHGGIHCHQAKDVLCES
jgi:hypothetical protein